MILQEYFAGNGNGRDIYCSAAQTFVVSTTHIMTRLDLAVRRELVYIPTIVYVDLYSVNGLRKPDALIGNIGTINTGIFNNHNFRIVTFEDLSFELLEGVEYAIVLRITGDYVCVGGEEGDSNSISYDGNIGYDNGKAWRKHCSHIDGVWACQLDWISDSKEFYFKEYSDSPPPTTNLISPENEDTNIAINTNFRINISAGSVQKIQLYLNGELFQEFEVINWSGFHWLNPDNDLEENTEYSWYIKVQDWNDPYGWHQSEETWTFNTGTELEPPGKAQNPTPEHEEENIRITGRSTLAKLEWEAPD